MNPHHVVVDSSIYIQVPTLCTSNIILAFISHVPINLLDSSTIDDASTARIKSG